MPTRPPDGFTALQPTSQRTAELDRLGDEIAELSAHLEAATARLLDLIRAFDARGGWNTGFRSCAAWLAWRVGLELGAARERVRVARALGALPRLAEALARGELSYAKVRALTRVATPATEARLLAVGRAGTAAHVERIVRGWRRVDRQAEAREAARQHAGRALHVYQDEDGMVVLRGRLAPEVGALLLRALDAARETLYQRPRATGAIPPPTDPAAEAPTRTQQQADALALWPRRRSITSSTPGRRASGTRSWSSGRRSPRGSGPARAVGAGRGPARFRGNVPAAGVRREPSGDAPRRGRARGGDRGPNADDTPRVAASAAPSGPELPLPGLPVRAGQGHHVRHWAQGGPTTLSNLALLCRRHHRAVHEEGYQVERGPDGVLQFRRPDGRPLPEVPPAATVPADPARPSARGTRRRGSTFTRARDSPSGWGSAWT